MTNYEKYLEIHSSIMDKLDSGEITVEKANEVNNLAFEKYVIESTENNTNMSAIQQYNDVIVECLTEFVDDGKYLFGSIFIESADAEKNKNLASSLLAKIDSFISRIDENKEDLKESLQTTNDPKETQQYNMSIKNGDKAVNILKHAKQFLPKVKEGDQNALKQIRSDIEEAVTLIHKMEENV